jgi:hypothetical protein
VEVGSQSKMLLGEEEVEVERLDSSLVEVEVVEVEHLD